MDNYDINVTNLLNEIEVLKKENLCLKKEIKELKEAINKNNKISMQSKAREAIQLKKLERISYYQAKIIEIVKENKDIKTKELLEKLEINNKTFYNLKLNEFFNNGIYFDNGDGI